MSDAKCPKCHKFFTLMDSTQTYARCPYCSCEFVAPPVSPTPPPVSSPTPKGSGREFSCPKCWSTNLTGNKKGFGLGKALVGGVLAGGVGLLGGFIGSRKITVTCMECGHSWEAGEK